MEDKDIIEQITEINLNHPCFDGHNKIKLIIPENWKFEQRGNKMFGIRKYPQYPTTYGECCDILGYDPCEDEINCYKGGFIESFVRLLICRDAYWKIAGEEMGLDKPWKYDMSKNEFSCAISYEYGSIQKCEVRYKNHFLVFPTKEMRDAFFENFKDLIEGCKELL